MKTTKDELINQKDLLKRNWTKGLIEKHLLMPDVTRVNRIYPTAPKIYLYSLKRVLEVEQSEEFQLDLKKKRVNKM